MGKIVKIVVGIFAAFIFLGILGAMVSDPATETTIDETIETPNEPKQTDQYEEPPVVEPVPTVQYEDEEWIRSAQIYTSIVADDLQNVGNAATQNDVDELETYSVLLYQDTENAIRESKRHSVSPELKDTKKYYETMMTDYNSAAVYAAAAVDDMNNGKYDSATENLLEATDYIESGTEMVGIVSDEIDQYSQM